VAFDVAPVLGSLTGVGTFCRHALAALAVRDDLDMAAFALTWRHRDAIAARLPAGVSLGRRRVPARAVRSVWEWGAIPPLEWITGPIGVAHGTNFVVPPTAHGGRVATVHDLTPVHHPELCNEATLAFPREIQRAIDQGAWIHAVSRFVADEVVSAFDVDPHRVRVVPHGVPPLPVVDPDVARRLLESTLPPGTDDYVLAVGTAEPRKDLPSLVRAFDQLAGDRPGLALVLCGPPGWGESALHESVTGAVHMKRIVRTGWVDDTTLAGLISRASVLAYPSIYEGFGFPPLQAMAAGVPVVATRAGALFEVLGDAALMVDVGDRDALVHALDLVLGNRDVRERLVASGSARAARFTWEKCADGLAELYRAVADARTQ